MRLVHGAQSEVHVAFYHAGRWSPTSAAVRWLEVGEGTTIGAAVVCPLPPERHSRGRGGRQVHPFVFFSLDDLRLKVMYTRCFQRQALVGER